MSRTLAFQPRIQLLGTIAIHSLWVCFLLWPLWQKFDSRLPIATEETRTVPLFNAWTIWWNADQLSRGLPHYWDAPIFHPDDNTFAYSEPQPFTMLLAPLVWWGTATIAYNTYVVLSLLLNGLVTHYLLRWLGYGWIASVTGGLMIVSLPVIHWQLGVVQLVPLWGVLWVMLAWARWQSATAERQGATAWIGAELGLAMAVTSWMAIYHAMFLTTLLIACVGWMGAGLCQRRSLISLATAVSVCCVLTFPMIYPMWHVSRIDEFVRPADMVEKLSLYPSDYLAVYGNSVFDGLYRTPDRYWRMHPGWTKIGLALCGAYWAWFVPSLRRWYLFLLTFTLLAFVLSMGMHLQTDQWRLWEWLTDVLPGFKQVRSPFRYGYFVQIGIALAAAGGLQAAWTWSSRWNHKKRYVMQAITLLAGCLALVDPLPPALKLGVVPDLSTSQSWCDALRAAHQSQPGAALCLPMAGGNEARDFERTCEWMLYGMQHRVPLINGYSGFCPQRVLDLGVELAEQPMTSERLEMLAGVGVRYLIIDRNLVQLPWAPGQSIGNLALQPIVTNATGIEVYFVRRLR